MQFDHVSFVGPAVDDSEILGQLPKAFARLLLQVNGFIQFKGGLHVRGACHAPAWHSLRAAWLGAEAFHRLYPTVKPDDLPFAEDCLGDQFLLRHEMVWRLSAETGDVESLEVDLWKFFQNAQDDPVEALGLHPLLQFQEEGGKLEPGQLLSVYPPFCTKESADGVSLTAVSTEERHRFLADFAAQIRGASDGDPIQIDVD